MMVGALEWKPDWLWMLRTYLAVSAGLHLLWEVLHLPLYTIWSAGTPFQISFAVLHCTAGDVMIAALSLLAALVLFGSLSWPARGFLPVAAAATAIAVGYTIYSEWLNTSIRNSWTYSTWMPTLPGLGTGLTPFLQWVFIPPLALWLPRHWLRRG